jgi:hypothetical protein
MSHLPLISGIIFLRLRDFFDFVDSCIQGVKIVYSRWFISNQSTPTDVGHFPCLCLLKILPRLMFFWKTGDKLWVQRYVPLLRGVITANYKHSWIFQVFLTPVR